MHDYSQTLLVSSGEHLPYFLPTFFQELGREDFFFNISFHLLSPGLKAIHHQIFPASGRLQGAPGSSWQPNDAPCTLTFLGVSGTGLSFGALGELCILSRHGGTHSWSPGSGCLIPFLFKCCLVLIRVRETAGL